jgi:hypothetical protein
VRPALDLAMVLLRDRFRVCAAGGGVDKRTSDSKDDN